jgi:hypothetical protein
MRRFSKACRGKLQSARHKLAESELALFFQFSSFFIRDQKYIFAKRTQQLNGKEKTGRLGSSAAIHG